MITQQEAFDKVYTHFITEKGLPSIGQDVANQGKDLICRYKLDSNDPNSPRCAVGLFIKDYNERLESEYIAMLVTEKRIPELEDTKYPLSFWASIQRCHDFATNHTDFHTHMEANLHRFAEKYDLQRSPISLEASLIAPESNIIL